MSITTPPNCGAASPLGVNWPPTDTCHGIPLIIEAIDSIIEGFCSSFTTSEKEFRVVVSGEVPANFNTYFTSGVPNTNAIVWEPLTGFWYTPDTGANWYLASTLTIKHLVTDTVSALGIVAGAVTATQMYHVVQAEVGVTDDLDTITPDILQQMVMIQADTGDTITVKHGTGNIYLKDGTDQVLGSDEMIMLAHDGTVFRDISSSAVPDIGCRAYNSGNQSIPNGATVTPLTFDTERYDTHNFHDNAVNPTRFTIPEDGTYIVWCGCYWNTGAGTYRHLHFRVSGGTWIAYDSENFAAGGAHFVYQQALTKYQFTAGQYVEAIVGQDTVGALSALSAPNGSIEFAIQRVG